MGQLKSRFNVLPVDIQGKVKELCEGRIIESNNYKKEIFKDAIEVVERAIKCNERCCRGLSREERIKGI